MPSSPDDSTRNIDDPIWDQALHWLFRLDAHPDSKELRRACDAWCRELPEHARAYAQAEAVWAATGNTRIRSQPLSTRRWRAKASLFAAAAALIMAIALGPMLSLMWRADYRTANGQRLQVTLPDGSQLALGSSSAIDMDYSDEHRRITLLAGRIYVDVKTDTARPFEIIAGAVQARALGTRYAVAKQKDGVEVSVAEGRVAVVTDDTRFTLTRGQLAMLENSDQSILKQTIPADNVAAWRRGLLIVEHKKIADVLARLDKYFPGSILITDPTLAQRQISGVFRLDDPAAAARAVVQPYGGQVVSYPWLLLARPGAAEPLRRP